MFTRHARQRMELRGVSDEDVEWALRRPIGDPRAGEPGTMWVWGHASGTRVLKVCVRVADPKVVISVAWQDEGGIGP